MPTFECEQCGEGFSSRQKRETHVQTAHAGDDGEGETPPLTARLLSIFEKRKLAAIAGGFLMVVLPLGAGVFYTTLGPDNTGNSNGGSTVQTRPPSGQGLQAMPSKPASLTIQQEYLRQLSRQEQLYLLYQGGPATYQGGIKPAVLLQYACTDCPDTVNALRSVAQQFNQQYPGQQTGWIYVAPYQDMDATVAATGPGQIRRFSAANASRLSQFACDILVNRPWACDG